MSKNPDLENIGKSRLFPHSYQLRLGYIYIYYLVWVTLGYSDPETWGL